MKVLASVVTVGFLVLGGFIPSMAKAEVGIQSLPQSKQVSSIKSKVTSLDSVDGIYLIEGAQWHSGCQSQLELVHQAAVAMGMGKDWYFMQQVFSHESCVDPGRVNSIGAKGLGQSLGHASFTCEAGDIPCQLKWFNDYANSAYGGWANSWSVWQSKSWW